MVLGWNKNIKRNYEITHNYALANVKGGITYFLFT